MTAVVKSAPKFFCHISAYDVITGVERGLLLVDRRAYGPDMTEDDRKACQKWAERTAKEQGLPAKVTDPGALANAAVIVLVADQRVSTASGS